MSETLGFEDKIAGLEAYFQLLRQVDPGSDEGVRSPAANPDIFYSAHWQTFSRDLKMLRSSLLNDMSFLGREEYRRLELANQDLRSETDASRAVRVGILAVMTRPVEAAVRHQRTEIIAGMLGHVTSGNTIQVRRFDPSLGGYMPPRRLTVDPERPIFAVFREGHVSGTTLTLQHDTPVTSPLSQAGASITSLYLPKLFDGDSLPIEPAAA